MVRYYGRARQRIGSVNTNQIGLKMSGCPSKVGRQGYLSRYIARRAQCNLKYCGPVFYHGVFWRWNSGRCVAKAPRGQSFNSGVGHKSTPRFACGNTCATDLTYEQALKILDNYFEKLNLQPALFAKKETLQTDLNHPISKKLGSIKHYDTGSANFNSLPQSVQKAVLVFNNIGYTGDVKGLGKNLLHVVGSISYQAGLELLNNGYGSLIYINQNNAIRAYYDSVSGFLTCSEVKNNYLCANAISNANLPLPLCARNESEVGGGVRLSDGFVNCQVGCSSKENVAKSGRCYFNRGPDGKPLSHYFTCNC